MSRHRHLHLSPLLPRLSAQRGYSLLELAVIGVFLGLLSVFSIDQISARVGDSQRANSLYQNSKKLAEGWSVVWQFCALSPDSVGYLSVGTAVGTNTAAANNMSLMAGKTPVASAYSRCFTNTGLQPMSSVMVGAAGSEQFLGYLVSWQYSGVFGRHGIMVSYAGVPDDVLLPLYRKHSRVATAASTYSLAPTATDNSDAAVQFTASTGGKRTVSILHPL